MCCICVFWFVLLVFCCLLIELWLSGWCFVTIFDFVTRQTTFKVYKKLGIKSQDDTVPMLGTNGIQDSGCLDNGQEKTYTVDNQPESCVDPDPAVDKEDNIKEQCTHDSNLPNNTLNGKVTPGEISQSSNSQRNVNHDPLIINYVVGSIHDFETSPRDQKSETVSWCLFGQINMFVCVCGGGWGSCVCVCMSDLLHISVAYCVTIRSYFSLM